MSETARNVVELHYTQDSSLLSCICCTVRQICTHLRNDNIISHFSFESKLNRVSPLQVSMCNTTTRPARNEWSLPAYKHDPIVYMHAPSTNKKQSNGSWRLLHPPAPFFLPKPNWLSCILDAFWVYTSDQIKNTTVKSGGKCAHGIKGAQHYQCREGNAFLQQVIASVSSTP